MKWLAQVAGGAIVLFLLADIFLTVLYARAGTGLLNPKLNQGVWLIFRWIGRRLPRVSDHLLTFAGPVMLIVTLVVWVAGLVVGFALIVWPVLGSAIQASQGPTPTDFFTALYYSGYSLTTLGTGDIVPQTAPYRLLMVIEAALGFSLFTLTLTYFLSVYNALLQRNTFAMTLQHRTADTGDAGELLAHLGAGGDLSSAQQSISDLADNLLTLLESHHFYPILHYMRFQESYYALPRVAFLVLDTASLLKSALDDDRYRSLVYSAAVAELWSGGTHLLQVIADAYPSVNRPDDQEQPDLATIERWRDQFKQARARLQEAGITTTRDTAAEPYVELRQQWEPYIRKFSEYLAYDWNKIAPVSHPMKANADA